MKNTVKKILALVFAVVMVCSLAVPALAADEGITVTISVVGVDGEVEGDWDAKATPLTAKELTLEKALKKVGTSILAISGGKVSKINGVNVDKEAVTGEFGTGSVVVAVNGKAISEDFATVALEQGDAITVYWADTTLGTKLAMVDDSRLDEGIVSLYYYDAEGNRQPLKGAKITLRGADKYVIKDLTNVVDKDCFDDVDGDGKMDADEKYDDTAYEYHFTTDEKGQIWIAPRYLDHAGVYTIEYACYNVDDEAGAKDTYEKEKNSYIVDPLKDLKEDDGYSKKEIEYAKDNNTRNVEDVEVIGYQVVVDADMYNTADATGDMTMVYVLVAAAAVITLAAVVVMKKKAVKAN